MQSYCRKSFLLPALMFRVVVCPPANIREAGGFWLFLPALSIYLTNCFLHLRPCQPTVFTPEKYKEVDSGVPGVASSVGWLPKWRVSAGARAGPSSGLGLGPIPSQHQDRDSDQTVFTRAVKGLFIASAAHGWVRGQSGSSEQGW